MVRTARRLSRRVVGKQDHSASVLPPAKNVHEELGQVLRGYAVFRPAPSDELRLYQVVKINSSPSMRSRSPETTAANLKSMFVHFASENDGLLSDFDGATNESFLRQFNQTEMFMPPTALVSVTEASLVGAGAAVTIPSAPSFGAGFSGGRQNVRQVRVVGAPSEKYSGVGLKALIWKHAESVFAAILMELDMELGFQIGEKSLVGIVTKRSLANVGVQRSSTHDFNVGLVASDPTQNTRASLGINGSTVSGECYDYHCGVVAIHFIMFPVQKIDRYKWRFFRGINVCNSEIDDHLTGTQEGRQDQFSKWKGWHQGEDGFGPENPPDHADVSPSNGYHASLDGMSVMGMSKIFKDVSVTDPPLPFIDVQISSRDLCRFANAQCRIAALYRRSYGTDALKVYHSILLLRSALRKCRYEPTVRALYDLSGCYKYGIGFALSNSFSLSKNTPDILRYCARSLKVAYERRSFYFRLLYTDVKFKCDRLPEMRLIEVMSHCGWPLQTQLHRWGRRLSRPFLRVAKAQLAVKRKVLCSTRSRAEKKRRLSIDNSVGNSLRRKQTTSGAMGGIPSARTTSASVQTPKESSNVTQARFKIPGNVRSFACPECEFSFFEKTHLLSHREAVHVKRPYVCTNAGCGRSFKLRVTLSIHERGCLYKADPVTSRPNAALEFRYTRKQSNSNTNVAQERSSMCKADAAISPPNAALGSSIPSAASPTTPPASATPLTQHAASPCAVSRQPPVSFASSLTPPLFHARSQHSPSFRTNLESPISKNPHQRPSHYYAHVEHASTAPPAAQPKWRVTPLQKEALLAAFDEDPYPELAKKNQLAEQLGVTTTQISKWFQHRRESLTRLGQFKAQHNRTRRTPEELAVGSRVTRPDSNSNTNVAQEPSSNVSPKPLQAAAVVPHADGMLELEGLHMTPMIPFNPFRELMSPPIIPPLPPNIIADDQHSTAGNRTQKGTESTLQTPVSQTQPGLQ